MPSFNIFKNFGGSKIPPPRPIPIIAKDYAYPAAPSFPPVSPMTAYSRSTSMPPEIVKSQPITDPSLGRRGTLKKKNKHQHRVSEDASLMQWAEPQHTPQDDILPGLPPPAPPHQTTGYQPNSAPPVYPEEYPYPYEDHHQQRFQYSTSTRGSMPSGMPGYESGPPAIYPEPLPPHGGVHPEQDDQQHSRNHRHHHHHHHHHRSPQHEYDDPSYAAPPVHGHSPWGPNNSSSRSRSRSFTPIPSVYREPDSMDLEGMYPDPLSRNSHGHGAGTSGSRRSGYHGPEGFDGHGSQMQTQARIGWLPDAAEQGTEEVRNANDPEATLVGDSDPQIIPGPIESDNPLQRNVYHTRESNYDPNNGHHHRTAAQEYAHENRHRGHGTSGEPRMRSYMYKDYHHSETIEPRMYERHPSRDEDSDPEEYRYVVPRGVHVVFRDHDGNAIARIGHPGPVSGRQHRDMTPFTVQDEYGHILYRHERSDGGRFRDDRYLRSGAPRPPRPVRVIMIDERGNQIPLKSNESHSSRSYHSQQSHRSQHSQPSQKSHPSQHSHSSGGRRGYH